MKCRQDDDESWISDGRSSRLRILRSLPGFAAPSGGASLVKKARESPLASRVQFIRGDLARRIMAASNIKKIAKQNYLFRKPVYRGSFSELAVMSIPPDGELGEEVHGHADELLFVVNGKGETTVGRRKTPVRKNDVVFIAAGERHNLTNTGKRNLTLVTVYSPPRSSEKAGIHSAGAQEVEDRIRHAWEQ